MSSKRGSDHSVESGDARDAVPRKKTSKTNKTQLAHDAALNLKYIDRLTKEEISHAFKEHKHREIGSAVVHSEPFTCVKLPNFVQDAEFLEGLKEELSQLIFYEKSNDLYKFQQSDDLKNSTLPHIAALRKLLYVDFLAWLKDVTGIPLSDKVDMTCAKYDYTDVLLCHDDELEGRRIAFILYLLPTWSEDSGGSLDLFDVDGHGQPRNIVKSLVPQNNNFVFFEVTPVSFHQVSEVLCQDKTRLSVSGWFHGPPIERPQPYIQPPALLKAPESIGEDKLFEWINPTYMDVLIQAQIQEKFSEDSEIELQNFIQEEKYLAVVAAITENAIKWEHRGPANKRNYEKADQDSLPEIVRECLDVMQSDEMFLLMSNFTGLKLHELAPESDDDVEEEGEEEEEDGERGKEEAAKEGKSKEKREINPRCHSEVRQWRHGAYTLLHDTDSQGSEFALDAMLFLHCAGWNSEFGGYVSYLAKGEDEELLSVSPADNSLALVYRDKETLRFVKHINQKISNMANNALEPQSAGFYDISTVYYE